MNMNNKEFIFEFQKKKVLIIGDLMVDEYITGKVKRISPEAPVPVLCYERQTRKAGGASNVAANVAALGAKVFVCGVAAEDTAGIWLREFLSSTKMDTKGIIEDLGRPTTVKTRFATKGQQLLRMDQEVTGGISEETEKQLLSYICEKTEDVDAVILSDYCKGMLENVEFVKAIIDACQKQKVLVAIDSKSKNIAAFHSADFVKPNNLELEAAVGFHIKDEKTLNQAGELYLKLSGAKCLVVTRGADGISIFVPGVKRRDFPAETVQVFDVTGAGDTVISTITLALVSGYPLEEAVSLANLAAGIVISKVGTATASHQELWEKVNAKQNYQLR